MGIKRREPITDTNLLLIITVAIFICMYALAMIVWGGGFLNPQQFLNIFNNNAHLIILSCGLTVVMIAGGIDISVGGLNLLVTLSCIVYLDDHSGSVFGAAVVALGVGLAFGLVQGVLISYLELQPFIVTLAGMFFAKGMSTIIGGGPRTAANEAFLELKNWTLRLPGIGSYGKAGNFVPAKIELGMIIALAVVAVIFVVLRWTKLGRNLYAIGGNSQSSMMLGINVKRTRFYSYLMCGLLSGVGGFVYLLHNGSGDPSNIAPIEMHAIAASIIGGSLLTGGVGNVIGTLFGVLSLKTITAIVVASGLTKPWWQSITTGAMLCFFIVLQSVVISRRGSGNALRLPPWLRFRGKKRADE
jgi:simple sugar transport system permease protein